MPYRRASDRLQTASTIAGAALLGFAIVLKFVQPAISDTLLLALVAAGAGLIHPSWLVDRIRMATKPPEDPDGPH